MANFVALQVFQTKSKISVPKKVLKEHDNLVSLQVFESKSKIIEWPKTSLQSMAVSAIHMQYVFITIQITYTIVEMTIYKYLQISNKCNFIFLQIYPIIAIPYPYRFLRLNPNSLSGLKSPYRA